MQEAMESNQENIIGGLSLSQDSSLFSDYFEHQEQKAGNRLTHYNTPFILLPSKRLLTASIIQEEGVEASEPSRFSSLKESSSSANSMPGPAFIAVKESSESFIARECSSQTLSEHDYSRGESDLIHRATLSSLSSIESIECNDSSAEATTIIQTSRDKLSFSRLSHESKEVNNLANDNGRAYQNNRQPLDTLDHRPPMHGMVTVDSRDSAASMPGSKFGVLLEGLIPPDYSASSSNSMTGFDLLVNAAMEVGFSDNGDIQMHDVPLRHVETDNNSEAYKCKIRYAFCPLQLSSPILKKRVVRRARSSFSKNTSEDMLNRCETSSRVKNSNKRLSSVIEKDVNTAKASHMEQQRKANQNMSRKPLKELLEMDISCKTSSALEAICSCSDNGSKQEVLQVRLVEASDASNKQRAGGAKMKLKQRKVQKRQKVMHMLPDPEPTVGLALKPPGTAVKVAFCENGEDAIGKEKKTAILERVEICSGRETTPEANAETVARVKFGDSGIKIKIGPVKIPSQAQLEVHGFQGIQQDTNSSKMTRRSERLRLGQHVKVTNSTTHLKKLMMGHSDNQQRQANRNDSSFPSNGTSSFGSQGNTITRESEQSCIGELIGEDASNIQTIELTQCDSSSSPHTKLKDSDPLVRSKRGRPQVLPNKFSDSILQPWKRTYRKRA